MSNSFATPWTVACQAPLSMGFPKQERILEWVAISFFRGSTKPRGWIHISHVSCIGRQILHHCVTYEMAGLLTTYLIINHSYKCLGVQLGDIHNKNTWDMTKDFLFNQLLKYIFNFGSRVISQIYFILLYFKMKQSLQ